jgi:hypothetical protein
MAIHPLFVTEFQRLEVAKDLFMVTDETFFAFFDL